MPMSTSDQTLRSALFERRTKSGTASPAPPAAVPAPPPLRWLLLEVRAVAELGALALMSRALAASPPGDGHPVLLLPGLMSSDWSTAPLRSFLARLGYAPYGWGLGVNRGPRGDMETRLKDLLAAIADRHGRKVSLIGTSLGGIYARQLAKVRPDLVRSVITLGSPFARSAKATRAWRLYEYVSGHKVETCDRHLGGALHLPPPVPTTAVYSLSDGICAWECCVERRGPLSESVRVAGSHLGLPHNPLAFHVMADRLAQKEGQFRHFPQMEPAALLRRILWPGR